MASIGENTVGEYAVGESENDGVVFSIIPLSIGSTDNQSDGVIRSDDGKTVYAHFRPVIEAEKVETAPVEIGANAIVGKKFVYVDTAAVVFGDFSVGYEFSQLSTSGKLEVGGLPLAPISVNSISELQFDGGTDYFPSILTLEWNVISASLKSVSRNTLGELNLAVDWNDGEGVIRSADGKTVYPYFRPVIEAEYVDTVALELAAEPIEGYLFDQWYDAKQDAAGLPLAPISTNAIGELQFDGGTDYFPSILPLEWDVITSVIKSVSRDTLGELSLAVEWNDGEGVVRSDDGKTVYPYFRPTIEAEYADTVALEIAVEPIEGYLFDQEFDAKAAAAGLPLAPISVSAISELQFDGGTDYFPSILTLEWEGLDVTSSTVSRVNTGALQISIQDNDDGGAGTVRADGRTEFPWFRPAVGLVSEEVPFKTLAAFSQEYLFIQDNTRDNLFSHPPLGPISSNAITEMMGIEGGSIAIREFSTVVALEIAASAVLGTNRIEVEVATTGELEIAASDISTQVYDGSASGALEIDTVTSQNITLTSTDTGAIIVAGNETVVQIFEFADTGVLGKAGATSIESISANIEQTPLVIAGVVETSSTRGFIDTTALEIEATGPESFSLPVVTSIALEIDATFTRSQKVVVDDTTALQISAASVDIYSALPTAETGVLEIASTSAEETTFVFADTEALEIGATTVSDRAYPFTDTTALEIASTDTTEQLFVFDDTGVFGTTVGQSVESISANVDVSPLIISGITVTSSDVSDVSVGALEIAQPESVSAIYVHDNAADLELAGQSTSIHIHNSVTVAEFSIAVSDAVEVISDNDNAVLLEVDTDFTTKTIFDFADIELLEVTGISSETHIQNSVTVGEIDIAASDSVIQIFDYVDSAPFIKGSATSIESVSATVEVTPLVIDVITDLSKTFIYSDTTSLVAGSQQAIGISEASTAALNIASTFVTRTKLLSIEDAALEITAASTQEQIFVFDDTAVFKQLAATDADIIYDIEDVTQLEIASIDSIEQTFVFDDTANFVKLGATEQSFSTSREAILELEWNVDSVVSNVFVREDVTQLEIASIDSIEQTFVFDDTATFVKLGATEQSFTTSRDAVLELEWYVDSAVSNVFNIDDTAVFSKLAASDDSIIYDYDDSANIDFSILTDQSSTRVSNTTASIEFADLSTQSQLVNVPAQTIALELDTISVTNRSFNIVDTATLGVLGGTDSEFIYNYETVTFNTFNSLDDLDIIYNYVEDADHLELSDDNVVSNVFNIDDTATFVKVGATSTEITANVDNEAQLGWGATDDVDVIYNFVPQAFIEVDSTETISKSVSSNVKAVLETGSITNQYYYTKFKQIYADDTIEFKLKGESNEMKITGAVSVTGADKQTWIG